MTLSLHRYHARKHAPKRMPLLEMSAFVDLAIVLTCCFAFWHFLEKPVAIEMQTPDPNDQFRGCHISLSTVLDLIIEQDKVILYDANTMFAIFSPLWNSQYPQQALFQSLSIKEDTETLRRVLQTHKSLAEKRYGSPDAMPFIFINPTETATFKNVIDVVDELNRTKIFRYTFVKKSLWYMNTIRSHYQKNLLETQTSSQSQK